LHGNKYAEYFFALQMVIVSGTLTFIGVQAGRLNRRAGIFERGNKAVNLIGGLNKYMYG